MLGYPGKPNVITGSLKMEEGDQRTQPERDMIREVGPKRCCVVAL